MYIQLTIYNYLPEKPCFSDFNQNLIRQIQFATEARSRAIKLPCALYLL